MRFKRIIPIVLVVIFFALTLTGLLISCGKDSNIDYIEVYNSPKLNYIEGEELDLTNAQIRVVYKNNSEKIIDVTPSMISGYDPTILGKQYLKIFYEDRSATLEITVSKQAIRNAVVSIASANATLVQEQNLNLNNVFVNLTLSNGATTLLPVTEEMCEGFDRNKVGKQTVTVNFTYEGQLQQVKFVVSVVEKELIGIEVTQKPVKNIYYVGDPNLSLVGGKLFLKYNNGYSTEINMVDSSSNPISGLFYNWDNITITNSSSVEIIYGGFSTSFDVQVKIRDVLSYRFIQAPIVQMQNIPLNLEGTVIEITYNNNEKENVALPNEKVTILGFDETIAGPQTAQIVFKFASVTLSTRGTVTLDVAPREEFSLEILRPNTPIYQDTPIDTTSWSYRIIYNNGELSEEIPFSLSMVVWEDSIPITSYSTPGDYVWRIVRSNEVEIFYDIQVLPLSLNENSIEFVDSEGNPVDIIDVFVGNALDTSDIYMTITYSNGILREVPVGLPGIPLNSSNVTFDNTSEGLKVASVSYSDNYIDEFTTSIYVNVIRRVVGIEVTTFPKVRYVKNEIFDPSGLELLLNYEFLPSSVSLRYEDVNFSGRGWTFSCVWFDQDNRFIKTDGEIVSGEPIDIVVNLNNPGLTEPYVIDVEVTNDFVEFSEFPFFRKVSQGGIEYFESVENLGTVLPGMSIDFGTYYIEVVYESETLMKEITSEMVRDLDINNTILSTRPITVFYPKLPSTPEEEETIASRTTYVVVEEKSITGISVVQKPIKQQYYKVTGGSIPLDPTGIIVHIEYDNNTFEVIDAEQEIAEDRLLFAGFNSGDTGIQTITVTYYDVFETRWETTFTIEVLDAEVERISWKGDNENVYWYNYDGVKVPSTTKREGDNIDLFALSTSAMTVEEVTYVSYPFINLFLTINYSDGTSREISYEEFYLNLEVLDYNKDSSINQHIKLKYKYSNESDIFLPVDVKMVKSILKGIYITEDSPSFTAIQGADIDLSGIKLGLEFETDNQLDEDKFVPMIQSYIAVSTNNPNGYDKTNRTTGTRNVTISYTFDGVTLTIENVVVTVNDRRLIKIELSEIPKQHYIEGQSYDASQGSITAYYNNGETETKLFSEAEINSQARYNISTINYDSSEFSGYDKVQRIFVSYTSEGALANDTQTLGYNIIMRDRKQVEVRFSTQNIYKFIYGNTVAPSVQLWGFDAFSDLVRNKQFNNIDFKVEYIEQNIWINNSMDPLVDYTVLPTQVGTYFIVVSYDGGEINNYNGDATHNKFQNSDRTLVIEKKNLYFSFYPGQKKIYGTGNPDILLILKGRNTDPILDNPLTLFAYQDNFSSSNFNPSSNTYPSICYLSDKLGNKFLVEGNPLSLNMFEFSITRTGGQVLAEGSAAGDYSIRFSANKILSRNYNLVYEDAVFKVEKRQVLIIPNSVSYTYGFPMPLITYTTSKVTDPILGEIDASGLYNTDTLLGQLNRATPTVHSVGNYLITRGDLGLANSNYIVVFDNTLESVTPKFVSILARNIYVRADSRVKTYGEIFAPPTVQYFTDSLCTITEGAFAQGDNPSDLGQLTFNHNITYLSPVGKYDVLPIITPNAQSNTNYNIVCSNGVVVVERRQIKVTPTDVLKTFGQPDPLVFTFSVSGISGIASSGPVTLLDQFGNPQLIDGVVQRESLSGALVRDPGENVGSYNIRIGNLVSSNPNYVISFEVKYLVITQKMLTVGIDPNSLSRTYNGQKPSIPSNALTIYEKVNGVDVVFAGSQGVLPFINVSCTYSLKNVGQYAVSLTNTNPNYSISLISSYIFSILPKTVRIQYNNLPANQQYKASPFIITAAINNEDLQYQYNEDGTVKTDQNNLPLYDNVSVYLTLSTALNAGSYQTKVESISDPLNYYLPPANNPTISFNIIPRILLIKINTNSPDGITYQREYNGFDASFSPADYSISNLIDGYVDPYPLFELGVIIPQGGNPSNVRFDVNGNVISYNVAIVENSDDRNFVYQLDKAYLYKITPKFARVSVIENYLTKKYDGNPPTITSGMYSFVEDVNIDKEDITFTFARVTGNDGRSNTDSGEYGITVACFDQNYLVSFAQNYFYTISKRNDVTISIVESARLRQYNGQNATFSSANISLQSGSATIPKVRNFLNNGSYETFITNFDYIIDSSNQLRIAIDKIFIDADTIPFTRTNISAAQTALSIAKSRLLNYGSVLESGSSSIINSAYIGIEDKLFATLDSLNGGNLEQAESSLDLAKSYMVMASNRVRYENTYLSFEFGEEDTNDTSNVGVYHYTFVSNDFNVDFALTYTLENRFVTITPKVVLVQISDVRVKYGWAKLETEYNTYVDYAYYMLNGGFIIKDAQTGTILNIPTITGTPRPVEDLIRTSAVGRYRIVLEDLATSTKYISESTGNYSLVTVSEAYFYIDKAILTLRLKKHGFETPIEYGTNLEMFAVQGYEYLDFDSSTFQDDQTLWQAAGVTGLEDLSVRIEKLKMYYGGIIAPHVFQDEIVEDSVTYNCYINPLNPNGGEIFNRVVNVATYALSATGFSTESGSYDVHVLSGEVKISRKPLSPKFLQGGSYLTRTYGNSYVDLSFNGILDQDLATFSNLPVYSISPEGVATSIGYSVGSPEFSTIFLNGDDPTFVDNADALNPTLGIDTTDLFVYFDDQVYNMPGYEYVLANYSFSFSSSYDLKINKRQASLRVVSLLDTAVINTVYGSAEDTSTIGYKINYTNLASHETAEDLGIDKNGLIKPTIEFNQNAGATILDSSKVYFSYDVLNNELKNYEFTVLESTLNVAKKPISIFVRSPYLNNNNQLPVMYERYINMDTLAYDYTHLVNRLELINSSTLTTLLPGVTTLGYQISPFIVRAMIRNSDQGLENATLIYGQYGINDFYAINPSELANKYITTDKTSGFAYSDTFASVFVSGYAPTSGVAVETDASYTYNYLPLNVMEIVNHTIQTTAPNSSLVGTYTVSGLTFVGNENYAVSLEPMEYKIVSQVGRMRPAKNQVILNSNKPNISDLIKIDAFRVDFLVGSISTTAEINTLGQSTNIAKTPTSPNESTFVNNNINYYLELEYIEKYPLFKAFTSYDVTISGTPVTLIEGRGTPNGSDATIIEVENMDVTTNVPVRIYDETTTRGNATFNDSMGLLPYNTTLFTANTYLSGPYGTPSLLLYDRVELSSRFVVPDRTQNYTASILINGDYTSGTYIALEFRKGFPGKAFVVRYDLGVLTEEPLELTLRGANPFDGYTHDIRIVFDKRIGSVLVTFDFSTSQMVYVQDMGITLSGTGDHVISEASELGFKLTGLSAYLRYFSYANQGYYDNYATKVQRVNVNSQGLFGNGANDLHIVLNSNKTSSVIIDTRTIFSPYMPNLLGQTFEYYVNGVLASSISYGDIAPQFLLTLYPGLNKIEVYVYYNNGGGDVLVCSESAFALVDHEPYSYKLQKTTETDPISTDGGIMRFYNIPAPGTEVDPTYIVDASSPAMGKYNLTQYGTYGTSTPHSPLIRSLEYSMTFMEAKIPTEPATYYLGESKFSFNFFMDGATYATDDGSNTTRGLSLILNKNRTAQDAYTYSGKLVVANRLSGSAQSPKQFTIPISEISSMNFDDGAIYTFGFYLDRDDIKNYDNLGYNRRFGSGGILIRILRNGVPVFTRFFDTEYAKTNASPAITLTNANYDIFSPIWLTPTSGTSNGCSIGASNIFRNVLYGVTVNKNSYALNDYLVDGAFTLRNTSSGNLVNALSDTASIKLSDGYGTPLISRFENATLKYNTSSIGTSAGYEWHIIANEDIAAGYDNRYYKGMKLVYDEVAETLNYVFYLDGTNYLAQPLLLPGGGLLDVAVEHTIKVVIDKQRYSTAVASNYVLYSGALALTDENGTGLPIHYGKAIIYIDGMAAQEVYYPYYESGEAWYRTNNDITQGTEYQGNILIPTLTPNANDENSFGFNPQFVNSYNMGELIISDSEIVVLDYSSHFGNIGTENLDLFDDSVPIV